MSSVGEQYRERAVQALTWSVSGQVTAQLIAAAFGIALARLLGPREFGLLAMVTVLTQFLVSISDIGFEEALVQRREIEEVHRSSVFWAMALAGCVLGLGTFLAAPRIAAFYDTPELRPLVGWLSGVFVLRSIATVPRALVTRRLDFRSTTRIECLSAAAAGACGVVLAWRGFGVASLALQILVDEALRSVLFLRASAWQPRARPRLAALRELLGFGVYRVLGRALGYWSRNVDNLLVGKFLGGGPLGLYRRAFGLMQAPVFNVSRAIARVTFPSLSMIQDDAERVRSVYLRTTGAVALATVPMCMGLFACAEPLLVGVLGPQWRDAAPLLRILSVAGLVQSITTLSSSLYLSQGRPDLHLRLNLLQNVSTIVAVVIGVRWGATGVAVAYVLATVSNALPMLHYGGRLVGLRSGAVFARTAPALLAGSLMTVAVLALDGWAKPRFSELGRLGLQSIAGSLIYWILIRLLRVRAYRDVLDALRSSWRPPAAS